MEKKWNNFLATFLSTRSYTCILLQPGCFDSFPLVVSPYWQNVCFLTIKLQKIITQDTLKNSFTVFFLWSQFLKIHWTNQSALSWCNRNSRIFDNKKIKIKSLGTGTGKTRNFLKTWSNNFHLLTTWCIKNKYGVFSMCKTNSMFLW